jgi:5-dehydro-4-deoxyglucarate dehydratase
LVQRVLNDFFAPLVALRDTVPGYAVSLVKAGVRLGGLDVGGVRAPLVDPSPADLGRLAEITDIGRRLAAEAASLPPDRGAEAGRAH